MVKPDGTANIPVGQLIGGSFNKNSYVEQPIDDTPSNTLQPQEHNRKSPCKENESDVIFDDVLAMEATYGIYKYGGEIPQDDCDLDTINQKMLGAEFNNIQGDHRKGRLEEMGVCLYDQVPSFENMAGVTIRDPPTCPDDIEEYNIQFKDKHFRQQLVNLRHRYQLTRDPPKLVDVRFKSERLLGKGAEAECFLRQDEGTDKPIVHKRFYEKPREREMDTLSNLHHQNIPAVYGMTMEEGRHVLLMEFCGDTLRHWKKNRHVQEADIWNIIEQLTDVLSFLEYHGVIHRDIKPGNVCIQQTGRDLIVKLIDFGSVQTAQDMVCQGGRMTAAYMAPEMWLWRMYRATPMSCKADMFACALTVCFLVYDADVVPQALDTNDEKQTLSEMIRNPSRVSEYVRRTFPLDKYSRPLRNLLLRMLDGTPGTRISAAEAHKQIVTFHMPSLIEYDENIKVKLGLAMVNHSAPLHILTPSATPSYYTETVPGIGNVYHVPNYVTALTSPREVDSLSPCEAVESDHQKGKGLKAAMTATPDMTYALISSISDVILYQPEYMTQSTTTPPYGLALPIQTCQQSTLLQGMVPAEMTTLTSAMTDQANKQVCINGAVPSNTVSASGISNGAVPPDTVSATGISNGAVPPNTVSATGISNGAVPPNTVSASGISNGVVPPNTVSASGISNCTQLHVYVPLTNQQPMNALGDTSLQYNYLQGLDAHVSETLTPNQDADMTAVPGSRQLILNQAQLLMVQAFLQNKTKIEGTTVPNPILETYHQNQDCQVNINPANLVIASERQARPEILKNLSDRLKKGGLKRSCPVLPSIHTNLPDLDLMLCTKKRRKDE